MRWTNKVAVCPASPRVEHRQAGPCVFCRLTALGSQFVHGHVHVQRPRLYSLVCAVWNHQQSQRCLYRCRKTPSLGAEISAPLLTICFAIFVTTSLLLFDCSRAIKRGKFPRGSGLNTKQLLALGILLQGVWLNPGWHWAGRSRELHFLLCRGTATCFTT